MEGARRRRRCDSALRLLPLPWRAARKTQKLEAHERALREVEWRAELLAHHLKYTALVDFADCQRADLWWHDALPGLARVLFKRSAQRLVPLLPSHALKAFVASVA